MMDWTLTSHVIVVLGLASCALQVMVLLTGGRKQTLWGIAAILVGAVIIAVGAIEAHRDSKLAAKAGTIGPPRGTLKDGYMRIELGSNSFNCPASLRYPLKDANLIGVDSVLSVRVDNGRLLASMVFYDLDGKIALTIAENHWYLAGKHERNYDERGVEVVDEHGFPIAQFEFTDVNMLRIGGVIRTRHGISIVSSGPLLTPTAPSDPWKIRQTIWERGLSVEPWFVYPSHSNLGKRKAGA